MCQTVCLTGQIQTDRTHRLCGYPRGAGMGDHKTSRTLSSIRHFTSYALIVLIGYFIYCQFVPWQVLTIDKQPIPVAQKEVRQGDAFIVWFESTKFAALPARISARWINAVVYQTPDVLADRECGSRATWVSFGDVPDTLPPAEYYVEYVFHYQVNIFRGETIRARTETFKVLAKDG
jgi:hypothetical protein